jgi:hypothetical protein
VSKFSHGGLVLVRRGSCRAVELGRLAVAMTYRPFGAARSWRCTPRRRSHRQVLLPEGLTFRKHRGVGQLRPSELLKTRSSTRSPHPPLIIPHYPIKDQTTIIITVTLRAPLCILHIYLQASPPHPFSFPALNCMRNYVCCTTRTSRSGSLPAAID